MNSRWAWWFLETCQQVWVFTSLGTVGETLDGRVRPQCVMISRWTERSWRGLRCRGAHSTEKSYHPLSLYCVLGTGLLFHFHNHTIREILLCPFYRWGNWSSETLEIYPGSHSSYRAQYGLEHRSAKSALTICWAMFQVVPHSKCKWVLPSFPFHTQIFVLRGSAVRSCPPSTYGGGNEKSWQNLEACCPQPHCKREERWPLSPKRSPVGESMSSQPVARALPSTHPSLQSFMYQDGPPA